MSNEQFKHIPPSDDLYGVDDNGDLLHLSATIADRVYDTTIANRTLFENDLLSITKVKDKYPNLSVQFLMKGVYVGGESPANNPAFTAVVTDKENPDTLILAFRGTTLPRDVEPTFQPGLTGDGEVQVQGGYHRLITERYFSEGRNPGGIGKGRDLANLVRTGTTDLNPNKVSPIKRIILTGHSLGGGLAQVAHQVLLSETSDFTKAIKENNVKLYTLSFSGLSSIAPKDKAYKIEGMTLFVLKDDPVPRMYMNVTFLKNFLSKVEDLPDPIETVKPFLMWLLIGILGMTQEVLEKYRHVGKIFHYESFEDNPKEYSHDDFNAIQDLQGPITFEEARNQHNGTLKGGFAWA